MPEHYVREVMGDGQLVGSAKVVYFWVRELADKTDGFCYAPVNEIARRAGIAPDTCSLYITELVKRGYLSRHRATPGPRRDRRRIGIVAIVGTLFASGMIGAAEPQASGASLTKIRPVASGVPETVLSGTKRRRRRGRHDDAA